MLHNKKKYPMFAAFDAISLKQCQCYDCSVLSL